MNIISSQNELNDFVQLVNFTFNELCCKHCKKMVISPEVVSFLTRLEKFRNIIKTPLLVTNSYRCPEHNQKIGGVNNSAHTEGIAADVFTEDMPLFNLFINAVELNLFSGVGVYLDNSFIHVDTKQRFSDHTFWVVKSNKYHYTDNIHEALRMYDFFKTGS